MRILGVSIAFCLASLSLATPSVTKLSHDALPVNGMLTIHGHGFANEGEVTFAGIRAIATEWTESRVTAYVPYTLREGVATLRIATKHGISKPTRFTVEPQQQTDGNRILWRFQPEDGWRDSSSKSTTPAVFTLRTT